MSEFQYKAGLHHVGSYQISGIPYVTGVLAPVVTNTPLHISFPSVTQQVTVHLLSKNEQLRIGFSSNGVKNSNYFMIDTTNNGTPIVVLPVRCTELYLLSNNGSAISASLAASLTGITGYNLATVYSGSAGIG